MLGHVGWDGMRMGKYVGALILWYVCVELFAGLPSVVQSHLLYCSCFQNVVGSLGSRPKSEYLKNSNKNIQHNSLFFCQNF